MKDSIDTALAVYYTEIKTDQKLIKDLNKSITRIVDALPEAKILQSVLGIEPDYSTGIIAEIGSIDCFNNEAKLAKYAGLAWRQKQSGDFDNEHTPLIRKENHYLRY